MLSVHRDVRHQRLGERMIRWAERLIAARGRQSCRLDCWAGSPFLGEYYRRLGYGLAGQHGGANGSLLFEKVVGE